MVSAVESNNRLIAKIYKTLKRIGLCTNPSTCLLVVAEGQQRICRSPQAAEAAAYDGQDGWRDVRGTAHRLYGGLRW
jgi:hypothetical protein